MGRAGVGRIGGGGSGKGKGDEQGKVATGKELAGRRRPEKRKKRDMGKTREVEKMGNW